MAIDALSVWKSELANLPKVADTSWALAFASWYADRLTGITTDPSGLTASSFTFTFPTSIFATALVALAPTTSAAAGIAGFAGAWETALLASTALVAPGSYIGSPSPSTTFSVVATTVIDPASIAAGKAKLLELASAAPVADPNDSEFPVKFREATLLLTITVSGLDASPTPSGPLPLVAANVPLI